jgi:hypothetical protein
MPYSWGVDWLVDKLNWTECVEFVLLVMIPACNMAA